MEAVIIVPIAMVVILFVVQLCVWAQAAAVVASAATQGNQAATVAGGTIEAGIDQARTVLTRDAGAVVVDPSVGAAVLPGDRIDLRIEADAESILPWIRWPISANAYGTIQEFRPD